MTDQTNPPASNEWAKPVTDAPAKEEPVTVAAPAAPAAAQPPAKPKSSAGKIILIVLGVLLAICVTTILIVGLYFKDLFNQVQDQFGVLTPTPSTEVSPTVTGSATPSLTPSGGAASGELLSATNLTGVLPELLATGARFRISGLSSISTTTAQNNVIYFGTYQGNPVLFYQINNENGPVGKTLVSVAIGSPAETAMQETTISLSDISNPVAVLAGQTVDDIWVSGAVLNTSRTKLYFALMSNLDSYDDGISDVIEYTLATRTARIVAEKIPNVPEVTAENEGAFAVNGIFANKYLVITEYGCWRCGAPVESTFVLNLETRNMRFLGSNVSDFQLDSTGTKLSVGQETVTGTEFHADEEVDVWSVTSRFTVDLP